MASTERIHYYHADASTLGGSIESPTYKIIPSQAQVSLPSTGGTTSHATDAFAFDNIVRCANAYCNATGSVSQKNGSWTTLVTSVVEGLNILEVVTADRVVGQISIEHPLVGNVPTYTFVGSQYVNLRIGGVPVEIVMNQKLLTPHSYDPHTPWPQNTGLLDTVDAQHQARISGKETADWVHHRYGWVQSKDTVKKKGSVLCSLVDSINGTHGVIPAKTTGHIVEIPEFGKFLFGEVTFDQGTFVLTMVRAELGCPVHGTVSAASARSNGSTVPPS